MPIVQLAVNSLLMLPSYKKADEEKLVVEMEKLLQCHHWNSPSQERKIGWTLCLVQFNLRRVKHHSFTQSRMEWCWLSGNANPVLWGRQRFLWCNQRNYRHTDVGWDLVLLWWRYYPLSRTYSAGRVQVMHRASSRHWLVLQVRLEVAPLSWAVQDSGDQWGGWGTHPTMIFLNPDASVLHCVGPSKAWATGCGFVFLPSASPFLLSNDPFLKPK